MFIYEIIVMIFFVHKESTVGRKKLNGSASVNRTRLRYHKNNIFGARCFLRLSVVVLWILTPRTYYRGDADDAKRNEIPIEFMAKGQIYLFPQTQS